MLMQCFYNVQPFESFFCSFTGHVIILNSLEYSTCLTLQTSACFVAHLLSFFPNNFRNPSFIVLDQLPSTSMIILYCWTVYPGYRFCNSYRNGPYFTDFSYFYGSLSLHRFCQLAVHGSPHKLVCLTMLGRPPRRILVQARLVNTMLEDFRPVVTLVAAQNIALSAHCRVLSNTFFG